MATDPILRAEHVAKARVEYEPMRWELQRQRDLDLVTGNAT